MVSTKSSVDELKLIDLKFCSLLDQCPPASFLYQLYNTLKQWRQMRVSSFGSQYVER